MKWIAILTSALVMAAGVALLTITQIESRQARHASTLEPYTPAKLPAKRSTAVVYFSRSGNTALVARHLANRLNADLYPLQVPDYALGVGGLARSALGAKARRDNPQALPDVEPRTIDLRGYSTVWLGSPVWFYSPAPPLWAFVDHNRFDGTRVVLFNTYNSNFGVDEIAKFRDKVLAKGAMSFEHRAVLRGRMTRQLDPAQMLDQVDRTWLIGIGPAR